MELSSTLSSTLGVQLPGTLVFDYPSVKAMAQYIHGLLVPAGSTAAATSLPGQYAGHEMVPAQPGSWQLAVPGMAASELISIAISSRLPTGYSGSALEHVACSPDGISLVPCSRWDLEALRVSVWWADACP